MKTKEECDKARTEKSLSSDQTGNLYPEEMKLPLKSDSSEIPL